MFEQKNGIGVILVNGCKCFAIIHSELLGCIHTLVYMAPQYNSLDGLA